MIKAKAKASGSIEVALSHLALVNEQEMQVALTEWFEFTQKQIRADLTMKFIKAIGRVTTSLTDWALIESEGIKTLKPATLNIMKSGGDAAYRYLALRGSFDVINVRAIVAIEKFCSTLVTNVTAETKKGINAFVKHGIKEGHSMSKIATNMKPLVGLTEKQMTAVGNYRLKLENLKVPLSTKKIDKLVLQYTNKSHRARVYSIATTETARAQNIGYVQGLEQIGLTEAEFTVSQSDFCAECEALNGQIFPLNEADGIIPVHPHCRCAMLPVIDDKTITNILNKPPTGVGV